ncbi:MAG: hypothetical protein HQK55_08245 [Deltaproteobacteria bacterium]|nr:hypothetical protein [Deltaproteobacteria bacterium]
MDGVDEFSPKAPTRAPGGKPRGSFDMKGEKAFLLLIVVASAPGTELALMCTAIGRTKGTTKIFSAGIGLFTKLLIGSMPILVRSFAVFVIPSSLMYRMITFIFAPALRGIRLPYCYYFVFQMVLRRSIFLKFYFSGVNVSSQNRLFSKKK